jgi:hypothetical protein
VDGNGTAIGDRVFDINPVTPGAANIVFRGLTIRNGAPLAALGENGGGIRAVNPNTTVTLDDSILTNNFSRGNKVGAGSTGGSGGGAWVAGTLRVINGSQVTFNHTLAGSNTGVGTRVNGDGAGAFARDILVDHSTVSDNYTDQSVTTPGAARGAGLFATRQVNVSNNSLVTRNRAASSGGGIADASTSTAFGVNITNSHVDGNLAGTTGAVGSGGGIAMLGAGASALSLVNSTANGNTALTGGGVAATSFVNLNNSQANGNKATAGSGGGILSFGVVNLTLGSQVNSNTAATLGGGIAATTATGGANLDDSQVNFNHALGGVGGGIASASNVTVANRSSVSNNTASTSGGGIFAIGASVTVTGVPVAGGASVVGNNTADTGSGGGIFCAGPGGVNLLYADVSGNTAAGGGGGIFEAGFAASTIDSSLISNNSTGASGGGLHAASGATLDILDSTLGENSATTGGGASISMTGGGVATLLYDTVNFNSAAAGGALLNAGPAFSVQMEDTLVTNNATSPAGGSFAGALFQSDGFNLTDDPSAAASFGGTFTVANGDNVNTRAGNSTFLGPLANNGGPTRTYALLAHSPAIDAGDDAAGSRPTPANPNGFDQRGTNRIQGAHSDIGAFELGGAVPPPGGGGGGVGGGGGGGVAKRPTGP